MQDLSLFESSSQPYVKGNSLPLNLSDYNKPNLTIFSSLTKTKSYTPLASCVVEHILTTNNFTNCEKLYYLVADSLSLINVNSMNHRSCALPSEDWADRLGCSRSLVFTMQKSLVKKGYFIISKDFDIIGRNKRNLITPTLPTSVFNHLNERFPSRVGGEHTPYDLVAKCKRSYLDRTKLFIKLNYQLLLAITTNLQLNSLQKIIWIGFYTRCYKNYMLQAQDSSTFSKYAYNNDSNFSFISSYQELSTLYSCSTKHLSKSIRVLEQLGFVKLEHLYVRKNCNDTDYKVQERQDQSLWKITLSLPKEYILELEKVKNRSSFKTNDIEALTSGDNVDSIPTHDCLILDGIKFNLTSKQASSLKSVIIVDDNNIVGDNTDSFSSSLPHSDLPPYDTYIQESDSGSKSEEFPNFSKNLNPLETFDNKDNSSYVIKSDPSFAKSALLLLNKDLILKIKEFKSNLRAKPKVIFNDFLRKLGKNNDSNINGNNQKQRTKLEFNISSELIRNKLKELPKDKADKARKFAYCLVSKKLANGYAASLNKHELAKQLIHHAATWKPTKLGSISREKEIDTALAVAWKAIIAGTWQPPLEWAKAEILQHEFNSYKQKYQESGILSHEIKSLEFAVNSLLGGFCDLQSKIIQNVTINEHGNGEVIANHCVRYDDYHRHQHIADINNSTSIVELKSSDRFTMNHSMNDEINKKDRKNQENYKMEITEIMEMDTTDISSSNINIDLSQLSEDRKYLSIKGNNDSDLIEISTINNHQYFGKLKMLEMNEDGDLVMTLKPVKQELFIGLSEDIKFFDQNSNNIRAEHFIVNLP